LILQNKTDWQELNLRTKTKDFLNFVVNQKYDEEICYIILFGSEIKGKTNIKSDIDIAVISENPLDIKKRVALHELFDSYIEWIEYQLIYTTIENLKTTNELNVNFSINKGVVLYERK
jgi:predicted nucleotidyltransferase